MNLFRLGSNLDVAYLNRRHLVSSKAAPKPTQCSTKTLLYKTHQNLQ